MSGKAIAIVVLVLLIAGAGVFAAVRGSDDTADTEAVPEPTPTVEAAASPAGQEAAGETEARVAGSYVDYRPGIIEESEGQRVLFFHAPWCPQCRSVEKGIKADGVPDGFTVIKVDYDSNQALRKKYGIKIQTSFLKVDADGNAVGEPFVAYEDPEFSSVVRNYLD